MRTFGTIIILFTIYQLFNRNIHDVAIPVYILLNVLALAFWATKDILHIDLSNKRIGEGFTVFGLRHLRWLKCSGIEKIYINSINTVWQNSYSLPWTVTVRDKTYKAFIKTNEGDKLFFMIDNDKEALLKKLNDLNKTIKTTIIDQS